MAAKSGERGTRTHYALLQGTPWLRGNSKLSDHSHAGLRVQERSSLVTSWRGLSAKPEEPATTANPEAAEGEPAADAAQAGEDSEVALLQAALAEKEAEVQAQASSKMFAHLIVVGSRLTDLRHCYSSLQNGKRTVLQTTSYPKVYLSHKVTALPKAY